jgi:type 2 lantibiotic biosynthesis protein LanM
MSAVGGGGMQRTPNRLPVLLDAGTDAMRIVRDFLTLPPSLNRPALGGEPIDPTRHADRVLAGFTATYCLLMHHRDELLAERGPIRRFADADIRVVLRPTRQYALILLESYHPDVLRDALDRDRLLDRLWVAVPSRSELESVVGYEHADLVVGDVPIFTSRADSRDLITTHGARIPDYFEQSGLDAAIARVEALGDEDLVRQQWVVRASLVGLTPGRHVSASPASTPRRSDAPNVKSFPASRDAYIDAAQQIAHRIDALALRQTHGVSWLGLTLARERDWVIQPVGADLYGGTLGIALFLAYLADVTGNAAHERLARDVLAQVVPRIRLLISPENRDVGVTPGSIGVFGTLGGAIYVLSHLGALWGDHALLDVANEVAKLVRDEASADRHLDIIAGVSGLIFALDGLHHARGGGVAPDVMRVSADRLLATTQSCDEGLAWKSLLASTQPLTGFSHGASGIAAALFTASTVLNEPRYSAVAQGAFAYERSTFDAVSRNWPDYRILDAVVPSGPTPLMWTWCHGAPGIGVARLIAMQHGAATEAQSDFETAIASTIRAGFGSNDSLCHGDLGNLDLLTRARELGIDGPWSHHLATESSRLVERIGRGDWRCGIPGGVETPGLMMGLAGIGYGLLRLGATERVPSLLSLEPPRREPLERTDP